MPMLSPAVISLNTLKDDSHGSFATDSASPELTVIKIASPFRIAETRPPPPTSVGIRFTAGMGW